MRCSMNVTSTNGVDKSSSYKGIKTLRAALISQIKEHYKTDRHDMPEEPTGAPHNGQDVHVEAPTPAVVPNKSRREIDASLAEEARVSTGQIRAARRLVRFGNENLIVAALLGV